MTDARRLQPIPCPFVYANGRACVGHVVRVEAYKADITPEVPVRHPADADPRDA